MYWTCCRHFETDPKQASQWRLLKIASSHYENHGLLSHLDGIALSQVGEKESGFSCLWPQQHQWNQPRWVQTSIGKLLIARRRGIEVHWFHSLWLNNQSITIDCTEYYVWYWLRHVFFPHIARTFWASSISHPCSAQRKTKIKCSL